MRKNNPLLRFWAYTAMLVCCLSAVGGLPVRAATIDVSVMDSLLSPATVNIQKGDTVRWTWKGVLSHSVTSGTGGSCGADGKFGSATQSTTGFEYSFTFDTAGSFPYFCRVHCPSMSGVVNVVDPGDPIEKPIQPGAVTVKLTTLASGLVAPNWGIAPPGDSARLFVSDQAGTLWAIDLASGSKTVFANLSGLLITPLGINDSGYDERGLLGVAFHPDYADNGLLYTYTSEPVDGPADFSTQPEGVSANHQSVVREWLVRNPADTASVIAPGSSSRVLLRIDEPQFNHNGGGLNFGKDGWLYISTGDGGNADDQGDGHSSGGNGQDRGNLLGKILRIDPTARDSANGQYGIPPKNPFFERNAMPQGGQAGCADGKCDEIYAFGLRNPFRFSFDPRKGHLYAGDVGQNAVEEINIIKRGRNYGWPIREGTFCFDQNGDGPGVVEATQSCKRATAPAAQYDHGEGHAVIGGFVYRGKAIAELAGRYVFGDYARTFANDGRLFYLAKKNIVTDTGAAAKSTPLEMQLSGQTGLGFFLLGFGQDSAGELYVLGNQTGVPTGSSGVVLKIEAGP